MNTHTQKHCYMLFFFLIETAENISLTTKKEINYHSKTYFFPEKSHAAHYILNKQ